MAKYDVFISCKSEDYTFAEEIYDFLVSSGINSFLASRELRKLGEAEYRRAISKALKDACHMIVFASHPEYIESTWVEYEWDMFVNAKLKGKKSGNIITILKDTSTDDIPMDLWKYESFPFEHYKESILQYVVTEEYKECEKDRKRIAEELRQRKAEEEAAKKREIVCKMESTAERYKKSLAALQIDIDIIYGFLKSLNVEERTCPICHSLNPLEGKICPICGWPVSPFDGIDELLYLNNDTDNGLCTYRNIYTEYKQLQLSSDSQKKNAENYKGEIAKLKSVISYLKNELLNRQFDVETLQKELSNKNNLVITLQEQISLLNAGRISAKSTTSLKSSEPIGWLLGAAGLGVVAGFAVILMGLIGLKPIEMSPYLTALYEAFIRAALPEEAMKFCVLCIIANRCKHFDEYFDGIVYAVCIGMGFAGLENILYLFGEEDWLIVGISRALLSVLAHYFFAVIMGSFFALSYFDKRNRMLYKSMALLIPIVAHGLYDFLCFAMPLDETLCLFILLLFFVFFKHLRKYSKQLITSTLKLDSYAHHSTK